MMWWHEDHWGIGNWFGMGFMTIFWVAVLILVIYLVRHSGSRPWHHYGPTPPAGGPAPGAGAEQPKPEALRILEERYARGEIDRKEFLERKTDLGG